jgi:hypothetical protein
MNYEQEYYRADPFNFLITLLMGVAAVVFVLAFSSSFEVSGRDIYVVSGIVALVYFVLVFLLFRFKKQKFVVPIQEREIVKEIERPVVKEVFRDVEKPVYHEVVKEVEKPVYHEVPVLLENKKPKVKKSKYVGSKYNERYHLRSCRFAGAIKKKYLVEEDERKYFKLRGYKPCKVCNPDKN